MLNFRVKESEKRLIDDAAARSGLNRSDFIKAWVMKGVVEMGVSSPTPAAPSTPTGKTTTVNNGKCPHPKEYRNIMPTGVKVCTVCGAKLR